jgi:uncharacterized protein
MAQQLAENRCSAGLSWLGIAVGLALPSVITWGYFVLAAQYSQGTQQAVYLGVKVFQFAFPLLWVCFVLREWAAPRRPSSRGLLLGAGFSIVVVAAGWILFAGALRDSVAFAQASVPILKKLAAVGIDSPWKYALLALFYSLVHSLLEEYYWRWFVFGQLRKVTSSSLAIVISAFAFAAHHVIVLAHYFGPTSPATWLLSSAVVVGGLFWAWLYEHSDSLLGPWLSHLLIDAGIFWIGYDLVGSSLVK